MSANQHCKYNNIWFSGLLELVPEAWSKYLANYLCFDFDFFPLIFLQVMFFSMVNLASSVRNLAINCLYEKYELGVWMADRQTTFAGVSLSRWRSCALAMKVVMSLLLIYGLLNISPMCLTPWFLMNGMLLVMDISHYISRVFFGGQNFGKNDLGSFCLPLYHQYTVGCVLLIYERLNSASPI